MAEPESSSTSGAAVPEDDLDDIASLSDMYPLLSEADIRIALDQCGGNLSSALDLLLTKDLVDCETDQDRMLLVNKLKPICHLWIRGECIGARATACRARHFYLESDSQGKGKSIAAKRNIRQLNSFSSPYKVRLVTEQIKIQREKVDIESGSIEKWHEIEERQLVDLTGCENEADVDVNNLNSKEMLISRLNKIEGGDEDADNLGSKDESITGPENEVYLNVNDSKEESSKETVEGKVYYNLSKEIVDGNVYFKFIQCSSTPASKFCMTNFCDSEQVQEGENSSVIELLSASDEGDIKSGNKLTVL